MTIYDEVQGVAFDLFGEFKQGVIRYIKMVPAVGGTIDNPGEPTPTPYVVNGTATGVNSRYVQNGLAIGSDLQVLLPVDARYTPDQKDFVEVNGLQYKIVQVINKPASGTVVVYLLIIRAVHKTMAKSLKQTLDDLLAQLAPVLQDAFIAAIADVSDTAILVRLIAAIEANNYDAAFRTLGMSDAAMRPITAALERMFEYAGNVISRNTIPRVLRDNEAGAAVFRFNVRNERAEAYLKEQSGRLITNIQEDTRVNVRNVMTVNLEAGNNPRTTALDIVGRINPTTQKREGGIIGLTQPQELYARNARLDLQALDERYFTRELRDKRFDSVVRKAIDTNTPLDQSTIDRLISRYKDNLLRQRGENIGRTETISSLNKAQYESYKQAIENGAAKASAVVREWDSAGDTRVRHNHARMDGQKVGLDEPFKTPDGEFLMFPGDTTLGASAAETINCRCRVKYKTDWLSLLEEGD